VANVPLLAEILVSEGSGPRVVPGAPEVVPPSVADVPAVALLPVLEPPASGVPPVSGVALPPVLVPPMAVVPSVPGVLLLSVAVVPPVPGVLLPPALVMPPVADVPPVPGVLLPPVADVPPVALVAVLNAPPVARSSDVPPDEDSAPVAPVLAAPPDGPGASAAPSVEQAKTAHAKSGANRNRTGLIAGFFTCHLLQKCGPSQAVTSIHDAIIQLSTAWRWQRWTRTPTIWQPPQRYA
jgi:hypothetical protein